MGRREAPNEMERGTEKYRRWIHEQSKKSDSRGNLPFKFSAPKKQKPANKLVFCEHCNRAAYVTESTIMVICSGCGKLYKVPKEDARKNTPFVWEPEVEPVDEQ